MQPQLKTKVIVVGGGLSGLSAAHSVLEHGGRVLLLEKNPFCGGNSTKATSGINGAGTRTQLAKNIPDNVAVFEQDIYRSASKGEHKNPYPLGQTLAEQSGPAVEWLINKFGLDLSLVARLGGHSEPRTHRGKERFPGMTITYALMEKLEEIEKQNPNLAQTRTKCNVTRLLKNEKGSVIGVEYTDKTGKLNQEFGPVVIATGGYGNDYKDGSLLAKHRPDLLPLPTTNGDHCDGSGIKLSVSAGADVVDMEWVQVHPTGLVNPKDPDNKVKFLAAEALRGVGGIMINAEGHRFVDELGRRDYVSGEMFKNKAPFRLILNAKASTEIEWHCKHYVGRGIMKRYNNAYEFAKDIGVSADVLKKTYEDYNKAAQAKTDQFGKKFFVNAPITMDEFCHVSIVTPVIHYCMGGLKVDNQTQCLNSQGKPVPGLYATGEAMGGVHGKNRLGGNSLLDCVVYGRIAGTTACKYLTEQLIDQSNTSHPVASSGAAGRLQALAGQVTKLNTSAALKSYSLADVEKHNTEHDCWVILWDKVYNVTEFLNDHPGGKDSLMLFAGKDATEQFDMLHQPSVLKKFGPQYLVGEYKK